MGWLRNIGKTLYRLLPWALSITYVLAVLALPVIVNSGYCNPAKLAGVCQFLPAVKLNEFDKWGSYLSGALVPISLLWVGMAFRLQQRQLAEQGRQQADSANTAYEAQKIIDRQTLISMSGIYVQRMETALQDFAGLIDSNAPKHKNKQYGPILVFRAPVTNKDVEKVFWNFHNILIAISRKEISEKDAQGIKALFVDSDVSDYVALFFDIYNEYHRRCQNLECLILMPSFIQSMARKIKYDILRSTCRWHSDEGERNRLRSLIGWTDAELALHYVDRPEDSLLEPFDKEKYYQ